MIKSENIPQISVIMGIYNSNNKEEVLKSIKSIQDQTFTNWECIICEDGSEDDTYLFLQEHFHDDERIILIQNKTNRGLCFSLNHALEKVRAPYIIRQDTDDYSRRDRFERLYSYMEEHQEIDVLGTGMVMYDNLGEWGSYKIRTVRAQKEDFLIGTVVAHPSVIMKTESLRKCGGYRVAPETRRCEDYDLFMRMYAAGCVICNIKDELYYYKADREGNKRKFINVVNECVVRYKGYKNLEMGLIGIPYVFKPIIMFLVPSFIRKKIRKVHRL